MRYPTIGTITINTPQGSKRFDNPETWKHETKEGTITVIYQGRTHKYIRGEWISYTVEDPGKAE